MFPVGSCIDNEGDVKKINNRDDLTVSRSSLTDFSLFEGE